MDNITIAGLLSVLAFFPLQTACIAKSLGRKFWVWFFLGLLLPFFSLAILLCLPIRALKMGRSDLSQKGQNGKSSYGTIELKSSTERKSNKYTNSLLFQIRTRCFLQTNIRLFLIPLSGNVGFSGWSFCGLPITQKFLQLLKAIIPGFALNIVLRRN